MTINLPPKLFDAYHEAMDLFLTNDNFSRSCTVYYPPIKEACDCNTNFMGGASSNVFQHGGPAPFGGSPCAYCGGSGFREKETTASVRLRILWSKKEWVKPGGNLAIADAEVQVIGYAADTSKILNAQFILLPSNQTALETKFTIAAEPFFHGFGKSRYFIAFLKRV